ncbi:hypothetical protein DFH09DRAFT_1381711 [Mycena vulgaris]|nr:hypothetical protein DFH09DRAFT_1381711 [Mycena vulgaris]
MASSVPPAAGRRPATFSISRIVAAAGPERLKAYIAEIFEPDFVALGYYTEENAETWLDIDKFMRWISRNAPKSATTPPSTPAIHNLASSRREHIEPSSSQSALPPSSPLPSTSSPIPRTSPPLRARESVSFATHASSSRKSPPNTIPISDSDEDMPVSVTLPAARKRKRTSGTEAVDTAASDSDCVVLPTKKGNGKARKKRNTGVKATHEVTKQFRVSEIIDVEEPQACWAVPDPDNGENFVYRLDMTDDVRDWVDDKGGLLSMAAIIKSEVRSEHDCQGVFICDQLNESLLDGHERYHPDDEETRALFQAEREVNVRETSSVAMRAAAFYKELLLKPCPHVSPAGVQCTGGPVYRRLKEMNFDGKLGFIGCQKYSPGEARSHRFQTIHRDVKEDLIRELLANDGVFKSDVGIDPASAECARVLPPRSGGKGDRLCPYTHVNADNEVIQGKIIHRKCPSTIRIFSPVDRSDRRAIIHLTGAHNHPKFPSRKLSRKGKDTYLEAINAARVTGLTVLKCDSARSTSDIFGGNIPGAVDPALANPRIKRTLIQKVKKENNPCGLGIEGVLFWQKQMRSLPHEKQYVWKVVSENEEELMPPRKFADMAKIVPDEPMGRIRRCPYLKTQAEMDGFIQWCKTSEYKVVRDWINDKDGAPWFFPSFNQFLSKIPEDDWLLTPGDTNLNESAHPYTNQHTGTNLSLLEAIQAAYKLDLQVEAKLRAIDENCVLVNHLNTKPQRDRRNDARRTSHFRQALGRREARDELENIDDAIQNSTSLTRELRDKKRNLQSLSGVKQTKRKGEKNKDKLPDEAELAGEIDMDGLGDNSSPTRSGPAPLYLMDSNFTFDADIQLDPSLEPLFPTPELNDDNLEMDFTVGDLKDYLPYGNYDYP